jgi:hypothetical protein
MELFGIILSIPAALIASSLYIALIRRLVGRFPSLCTPLILGGGAVLVTFTIEAVLLLTIGAVKSQALVGTVFYGVHLSVFFLGVPALANVLILRRRERVTIRRAIALCTVFAFILVLIQYNVTEALYGVE